MQVALEQRGEWFLRLPFGVLRCESLNLIDEELELRVSRLLSPERSVVVEDGNSFGHLHEIWRAFLGYRLDEGENGLLSGPIVP